MFNFLTFLGHALSNFLKLPCFNLPSFMFAKLCMFIHSPTSTYSMSMNMNVGTLSVFLCSYIHILYPYEWNIWISSKVMSMKWKFHSFQSKYYSKTNTSHAFYEMPSISNIGRVWSQNQLNGIQNMNVETLIILLYC